MQNLRRSGTLSSGHEGHLGLLWIGIILTNQCTAIIITLKELLSHTFIPYFVSGKQ